MRLAFGFGVLLVMMGIIGLVGWQYVRSIARDFEALYKDSVLGAVYLAKADAAKGENVFKKCAACHNAEPGGANALGPALYGVMGNPVAGHPGFAFSDPLKSKGGSWDWETMSAWLANPKKFAPGTKMTFAGLSNPQDRADVMAFLNSRDSAPLPIPAAPPEASASTRANPFLRFLFIISSRAPAGDVSLYSLRMTAVVERVIDPGVVPEPSPRNATIGPRNWNS